VLPSHTIWSIGPSFQFQVLGHYCFCEGSRMVAEP